MVKRLSDTLTHLALLIYVAVILYPLFFVLNSSLKGNTDIIKHPWKLPAPLTLKHYADAISSSHIGRYFANSLFVSTLSTVISLLLALTAAFAVTRMRFPRLSRGVYGILLLSLLIPPVSLLIPLYIMIRDIGIYNTPLALLVPYSAFGIPLTVFVLSSFLKSIPHELEEAGVMDGLTAYGILGRILFPLTVPTLVTVFILNFLGNWNEFIMANLFLSNQLLRTLPVAVVSFMNKYNMNYGALTASVMISAVPVVIVYMFLQRKIIEGVTAGSVKG